MYIFIFIWISFFLHKHTYESLRCFVCFLQSNSIFYDKPNWAFLYFSFLLLLSWQINRNQHICNKLLSTNILTPLIHQCRFNCDTKRECLVLPSDTVTPLSNISSGLKYYMQEVGWSWKFSFWCLDWHVPLCFLQLALLQEEWRGRSLSSQLMTGAELEESSTTDGFQHPRIRSESVTRSHC